MDKKDEKITLLQGLKCLVRAYKILNDLFPHYFALGFLVYGLRGAQPLVNIFLSSLIIGELAGARDIRTIVIYVIITIAFNFLFRLLFSVVDAKIELQRGELSWNKVARHRNEPFARLDYEYVEDPKTNELLADIEKKAGFGGLGLLSLMWSATWMFERLVGTITSVVILGSIFAFSITSDSFLGSHWVTAIMLITGCVPFIARLVMSGKLFRDKEIWFKQMPKVFAAYDYYFEYIKPGKAGKDLRIYNQQKTVLDLLNVRKFLITDKYNRTWMQFDGVTQFLSFAVGGITYIIVGLRALARMYGLDQVVLYVGAINSLSENLTELVTNWGNIWEGTPVMPQLFEYLDLPPIKQKGTQAVGKLSPEDICIEFCNVSFKYPGTDKFVLNNINLKFDKNTNMAIVGMNGSGKTTMIKLLTRLYDPTEGVIKLNGIDIKEYVLDEYLRLFAVVFQDFELLAFTLKENVAAGEEINETRVNEVLAMVGFEKRTDTMPKGLDTFIYKDYNKDGTNLSGGEAQKVAIARAIYRNSPFVILDEPTAALDPISEFEIYSGLNNILGSKMSVYISHRLSSCRFCNVISVFHDGRIIQTGAHEKLIEDTNGKYYELWNAQAQHYV